MLHISVNENIFVEEYKVVMDFNEDVLSFLTALDLMKLQIRFT